MAHSIKLVMPTPIPTIVKQTIIATMGSANRKSIPNPKAGTVRLHAPAASKKNPGISSSMTSPKMKLAPQSKVWCQ